MKKTSLIFLVLIAGMTLIGAYSALFPVPASTAFIRFLGLSAFLLLCVSLMIGPLSVIWPKAFAELIEPRRAVGIACFVFVLFHLLLVALLRFGFDIGAMIGALNLWISAPAAILLLIIAITSSDFAIKKMGPLLWKNVQRLNYLAFILSFAHFILDSNGLFTIVRGKTFVNLAEAGLVVLGGIAILLQIAGFAIRRTNFRKNLSESEIR